MCDFFKVINFPVLEIVQQNKGMVHLSNFYLDKWMKKFRFVVQEAMIAHTK